MKKNLLLGVFGLVAVCAVAAGVFINGSGSLAAEPLLQTITVNTKSEAVFFPHFWEHVYGWTANGVSGKTADLSVNVRRVREVGDAQFLYHRPYLPVSFEGQEAQLKDNQLRWNELDQFYDALLQENIRPFISLGVEGDADASKARVSEFVAHLIERYGLNEVKGWQFELTGSSLESGDATQKYFDNYGALAGALKQISPALRIGGPGEATPEAVEQFIAFCHNSSVSLDFVSVQAGTTDEVSRRFNGNAIMPRKDVVAHMVQTIHKRVQSSALPYVHVFYNRFQSAGFNEAHVSDSAFMGPWLANNIAQCDGRVRELALWTCADLSASEVGQKAAFSGGFGLVSKLGVPKAAFNAMAMLHKLGTARIQHETDSAIITLRPDGSVVMAVWNYLEPGTGALPQSKIININLPGTNFAAARVQILDHMHGSSFTEWRAMGTPGELTEKQRHRLSEAATMPEVEHVSLGAPDPVLSVKLRPNALALIEFPVSTGL